MSAALSGAGSGTVTSSPAEIDCGATCAANYGTHRVAVGGSLDSRSGTLSPAAFDLTDPHSYGFSTRSSTYDSLGISHTLDLHYLRTAANSWSVFGLQDDVQIGTGAIGTLVFQSNGSIDRNATALPFIVSVPVTTGAVSPLSYTLDLTGTSNYGGSFGVSQFSQDGHAWGGFAEFSNSGDGWSYHIIPGRTPGPGSFGFDSQMPDTHSAAQTMRLMNAGTLELEISAIEVSGDFLLASNTCDTRLAAEANCVIGISFSPRATGARSGTLSITDNALNSPHLMSLSGTGAAVFTMPGAPVIDAVTLGNGSASVAFTAPGSDGGASITGYTVTSNPGSVSRTGLSSPIEVPTLSNGTTYTFTVKATNAAGSGAASAPSNAVTPSAYTGTPSVPSGLTASSMVGGYIPSCSPDLEAVSVILKQP